VAEVAVHRIDDSDLDALGTGIVGRALALLLEVVAVRPLFARVASDNVPSLKVLRRAGFAIIGTEISFANGRKAEIEETILRLDEPANSPPSDGSTVGPTLP
jgi:RimJ/RimL family protein N-acetyltransferase